jgi:hypothetical protein
MNKTVVITKMPKLSGKESTPDGALCGNGDIGIVLGNAENGLRIYVAKNDMWLFCENGRLPGGIKPIGYIDIEVPPSREWTAAKSFVLLKRAADF